jgi:acyl-CoA hydrolase
VKKPPKQNLKSPQDSFVISRKLVMPDQINSMGGIFGGNLMAWIDKVGAMVAQRHAALPVVTASIDQITFLAPVRVSNHVILEGIITYVGNSSMEISVGVWAENPFDGSKVQTTQAFLTFVALDSKGKPTRVPGLRLSNEIQHRLFEEAKKRVATRSKNRQSFRSTVGKHPTLEEILAKS